MFPVFGKFLSEVALLKINRCIGSAFDESQSSFRVLFSIVLAKGPCQSNVPVWKIGSSRQQSQLNREELIHTYIGRSDLDLILRVGITNRNFSGLDHRIQLENLITAA